MYLYEELPLETGRKLPLDIAYSIVYNIGIDMKLGTVIITLKPVKIGRN